MEIQLNNIGKRFGFKWIFKDLDYHFTAGKIYALTGYNGSGKSTLLKLIAGFIKPSKGELEFLLNKVNITTEELFKYLVYTAPYIDIEENFTLKEHFEFYFSLKSLKQNKVIDKIIDEIKLTEFTKKQLLDFSSGMLQKVKLASLFNTQANLYLLDEPTSNLDNANKQWFEQEILKLKTPDCIIIIASNEQREIDLADEILRIEKFKNYIKN